MQENRETSEHIGTDCSEQIEADIRDLVAHFSSHDCMPFPAGPLLPRQKTKEPPLLIQELSPEKRSSMALLLWPQEQGANKHTNTLNRLHKLSTQTWSDLHDQILNSKITPHAWSILDPSFSSSDQTSGSKGRTKDQIAPIVFIIEDRIKLLSRDSIAKSPTNSRVPDCAYPAGAYPCDCHKPTHVSCFDEPGTITSNYVLDAASLKLLATYPQWSLLLRFWLKQLQNHHGFIWKQKTAKSPVNVYHKAALGVLFRLRRTPEHPQASVAAALTQTHLLPPRNAIDAEKWYEQLLSNTVKTNATTRAGNPVKLPDAFCLDRLGNPEVSMKEAQLFWKALGHSEKMLQAVDTLAREVASLMTDPWQVSAISWSKEELTRLHGSVFNELLKSDMHAKLIERITPGHRPEDFFDRIHAMKHYVNWVSQQWDDLLDKSTISAGG